MRHRITLSLLISLCFFIGVGEGLATQIRRGAPPGLMRSQSRAVERSIRKNIAMVFRPRLVIARGATGPVSSLALSRDEKVLMTSVGDNSIRLWDLDIGREIAKLPGHKTRIAVLSISPDGQMAASADTDGDIGIWDLKELKMLHLIKSPSKDVRGLYFNSKGDRLITGSREGKIRLWDVKTGKIAQLFTTHEAGMSVFCIYPDDHFVISCGLDGKLSRHNMATGRHIMDYEGKGLDMRSVFIGTQGTVLAGGGAKGEVFLWDADTGRLLWKRKGHKGPVKSIAINEKAGLMVSGGDDGQVLLWHVKKGERLKVLGRHKGPVNFVQVDTDGNYVLSASEDGLTNLWNTLSGNLLVSLISTKGGWAIVDTKGRFDGNETSLAGIEWQDDNLQIPISNFTQAYYEPALLPRLKNDPKSLADVKDIPAGVRMPPKVEIVPPDNLKGKTRAILKVRVNVQDQGGGIGDVRLYRNGKLVGKNELVKSRNVKNNDGSLGIINEYEVKLNPGENILSAIAINNEQLESLPSSFKVGGTGGLQEERLRLIAIGVNEYKNKDLNLDYAENDANSIRGFFIADQAMPFICESPVYLLNNQATKTGILNTIRSLQRVPQQDIAVIYMAGHGVSFKGEWYFIPFELEHPNLPEELISKGLSSKELKREIEAISTNRVFLIIDACHSGTAVSPIKKFQGMKALRMLARTVGLHILSATDRNQFSVELHKLGHGVFTYSLLNALKGLADSTPKDRIVSVKETMQYVEEQVPILSKRYANYTQFPTAHSRGIDFNVSNAQ
ncbi:MAG: caspase family protein [Thermodesulfobacteriota bacterium]|nr:caspase family protein [Thermodesulfobacteriota bacterium]